MTAGDELGDELMHEHAVLCARNRAYWRECADAFTGSHHVGHMTRRQCLNRARRAENSIVNLAIRAEIEARRSADRAEQFRSLAADLAEFRPVGAA